MVIAAAKPAQQADTRGAILDIAERLVQARGFNGFSYADIAAEMGVTKAALHYHFTGKSDLGEALISRYAARFADAVGDIETANESAFDRLVAYTRIYSSVFEQQRMCLCGMLAAEYHTLPEAMRRAVIDFFDANHGWLTRVLVEGRTAGTIRFAGQSGDAAQMIVGTLEGAMLVARPYSDTARFQAVVDQLLRGLRA